MSFRRPQRRLLVHDVESVACDAIRDLALGKGKVRITLPTITAEGALLVHLHRSSPYVFCGSPDLTQRTRRGEGLSATLVSHVTAQELHQTGKAQSDVRWDLQAKQNIKQQNTHIKYQLKQIHMKNKKQNSKNEMKHERRKGRTQQADNDPPRNAGSTPRGYKRSAFRRTNASSRRRPRGSPLRHVACRGG